MDTAREVYGDQFPAINRYVDILASAAVDWGLLGPREADRMWDRHILNCAALGSLIIADSCVADVGSGAGLPGIPLALLRPDLRVTLIEPLLRRSTFLGQTIAPIPWVACLIYCMWRPNPFIVQQHPTLANSTTSSLVWVYRQFGY